uniref:18S rRNA (guanine-N(7))-methyltransferase n=1 Tax=Bursaphelenchus xylophilus TaxID=6326 RepID=A0A1I7SCR2_BURXY
MSRPEFSGPPELFYNETEAKKYAGNSRMMEIQTEMAARAVELMALADPETAFILDIGCGSGISGQYLTDEGLSWMGIDISAPMLEQAKEYMEVEEDLILGDIGNGLPFRPGVFDGAISISAIQWLCHANRSDENPAKRLLTFFQTLFASLSSGARAVFQFYPENPEQAELICQQANKAGFSGGLVVDFPESTKAKKVYLVAMTSGIQRLPKALTGDEDAAPSHVDNTGRRTFNTGRKVDKKLIPGTREWVEWKKQRQRNRGREVKNSSKYTGRRRRKF